VVDGRVALDPRECLDDLVRPRIEPAEMAPVEDHARRLVLRIVGRLRFLVPAEGLLDLRREQRAQPVRLGDEVGERGGRVGEDECAQPGRVRERVLLAEEPAPGLAEDVVAVGDPERADEVVQLPDEQVDRPEVGAAVRGSGLLRPLPSWS
jgi:hypothetical protein